MSCHIKFRSIKPKTGFGKFIVRCEHDQKNIGFKYNVDDDMKGVAEFETNVIESLGSVVNFDIGKSVKEIGIVTKWNNNHFVELDLTYTMTEDTFDGTMAVKTSIKRWGTPTTFGLKYNIAARPSASVSYERDGIKKEILTGEQVCEIPLRKLRSDQEQTSQVQEYQAEARTFRW